MTRPVLPTRLAPTHPMPTRRQLFAGAALLAAPALLTLPRRAEAAAPLQEATGPVPFHRFMLGSYEVTTLLAGTRPLENPHETFGLNASAEEFAAAAEAAFVPADMSQNFFTPTLVNTGGQLVLFDTGLAPEGITAALNAAGYAPAQVDVVVLTHMHGDHIGGLANADGPLFANASYVAGQVEFDHWAAAGNEGFDGKVRPLAGQTRFIGDGDTAAPGITAILAPGHTPGHMAFRVESDGKSLILIADAANHFAFSIPHPDWEVRFDMDKAQAAETRRSLLGMIAADRLPFIGYHMPFPALGYLETAGDGFRFVPASYQQMLPGFG